MFSPVEGIDHVPVDVESHVDGGVGVVVCPLDIPSSFSSLLPILTANAMSNKRLLLKSWFSSLYLSFRPKIGVNLRFLFCAFEAGPPA